MDQESYNEDMIDVKISSLECKPDLDVNISEETTKSNESGPLVFTEILNDDVIVSLTKRKRIKKSSDEEFICEIDNCNKVFSYSWMLRRHQNSHNPFKAFSCDVDGCNSAYKSKENLILHFKNKHLDIRPYKCSFCKARFSHRNGRTYHERKSHTGHLPYQCDYQNCDMEFASLSALKYHNKSKHNS